MHSISDTPAPLDELAIQNPVLASLINDFSDSDPVITQEIVRLQDRGHPSSSTMGDKVGTGTIRHSPNTWAASTGRPQPEDGHLYNPSTAAGNRNSLAISPGEGQMRGSVIPMRKRSIGSSHLTSDSPSGNAYKFRRTTPEFALLASPFAPEASCDVPEKVVIDLTGDNDTQRQKAAEVRASRVNAEVDRDAAIARALSGGASVDPNSSTSSSSSQIGQHNAYDSILGRSSHSSSQESIMAGRSKEELGWTSAARPPRSANAQSIDLSWRSADGSHWSHSTDMAEMAQNSLRAPVTYIESDDETDGFGSATSRASIGAGRQLSQPSLPPFSSLLSRPGSSSGLSTPALPSPRTLPPALPATEVAQQTPMAWQDGPWLPVSASGQQLHTISGPPEYVSDSCSSGPTFPAAQQPGYVNNGAYYPPWRPQSPGPSLAEITNRVNNYDFNSMTDMHGNPLNERLRTFIHDCVNDPRKTEEDIRRLLSNIRPDMDVPEEERGETPDAMKYPLYPHQQLALKWMSEMEEGTNKGGILADDMGLGKTVSTLALIVSRPSTDDIKTNLIIGPVALIKQWELEVKKKLKSTHALSAFRFYSKKRPYSELKKYDVVLTTYGSVAAEWKKYSQHVAQRNDSEDYREEDDMELFNKCPILHPRSRFYRIILDEAQCIKNKDTQSSTAVHRINATYRWCLTGTPMMNGVSELYPLIRFLRIRPYSDFRTFQADFKVLSAKSHVSDYTRDNAMRKLQAVLKAMMLRRMKDSMIDGKPILTLPPRTESSERVEFSEDERQFYQDLETRSRVQFNKFLRAGTVGKNYSNILVLLLRLRQACCHPHLIEFESVGAAIENNDMESLARRLDATVVERIKAIKAFECPICYDGVEDPLLVIPCGHDTCTECFTSLTENTAQDNIRSGDESRVAKCPVCRGPVDPKKVITLTAFRKVHAPEALEVEDEALGELSEIPDSEYDEFTSDSESEIDADRFGNLAGFVVPDSEDSDLNGLDDAESDAGRDAATMASKVQKGAHPLGERVAQSSAKPANGGIQRHKAREKGKGRRKAEVIKPHMLKELRNEADKNREARRRYIHYLRDNWEDSAKVTRVIELLREIQETEEKTIIFSQWTTLLDLIECQIKYKLKLRYCRYTGKMSRNQRDEAIQDFIDNPRNTVLLVSLRAGNAGLNLTAASRIIICDPFWNPFIEAQAVDRAHRIGQQREVKVHRILVRETVEDRILALQENKRELVETALDEGQGKNVGRLSEAELAYLFGVSPARG
ncbi:hypothetical protein VTH06DRAFT_4437 [Thermothelomyces fergusii]